MVISERADLEAQSRPLLAVTRGQPTPDELAALLVVLTGRASRSARRPDPGWRASEWSAPARMLRSPVRPGPGAWRASALPG